MADADLLSAMGGLALGAAGTILSAMGGLALGAEVTTTASSSSATPSATDTLKGGFGRTALAKQWGSAFPGKGQEKKGAADNGTNASHILSFEVMDAVFKKKDVEVTKAEAEKIVRSLNTDDNLQLKSREGNMGGTATQKGKGDRALDALIIESIRDGTPLPAKAEKRADRLITIALNSKGEMPLHVIEKVRAVFAEVKNEDGKAVCRTNAKIEDVNAGLRQEVRAKMRAERQREEKERLQEAEHQHQKRVREQEREQERVREAKRVQERDRQRAERDRQERVQQQQHAREQHEREEREWNRQQAQVQRQQAAYAMQQQQHTMFSDSGATVYTGTSGGTFTLSPSGNRQYFGGNGYGYRG